MWLSGLNSSFIMSGVNNASQPPLLRFPVLLRTRENARDVLMGGERQGLGIGSVYPKGVHQLSNFSRNFLGRNFPGCAEITQRMVTLPVHKFIGKKDKYILCNLLLEYSK
jgi:perosamine synthetase